MKLHFLFFIGFTVPTIIAQTCDCDTLRDQMALRTFARAMTGHAWDTSQSVKEWIGVGFNEMGCIESLEAPNLLMEGVIPVSSIGHLLCIKYVDLHQNKIFGPIPPDLQQLNLLEGLNLSRNEFSNTIPVELSKLQNLRSLRLNHNFLSGQIPEELGELTELRELFLGNNELSGNIPESFASLINLFGIDLSHNQFTGRLPSFFQNLAPLAFHINDNHFQDTAWVNFAPNFTGTIVNISNNEFSVLPLLTSTSIREEKFMAQENRFTFDDLLPNFHLFSSSIVFGSFEPERYSPQKEFYPDTLLRFPSNEPPTINLGIDPDVLNNLYKWYKEDILIHTGNSPVLNLNELFNNADQYSGVYRCEVENNEVPLLTLNSGNITIEIEMTNFEATQTPTAFTPNQDGVNDYFVIPAVEDARNRQNEFIIYNRNGEQLFRAINYMNEWDGTDSNHIPLANGTYYFLFKANDYKESGMVTIQR